MTAPAGRGGRKLLALTLAGLATAAAVSAARGPWPDAPSAVAAAEALEPGGAPAPQPAGAVAAAEAFLAALDPALREKAVYDFDSPKKPNWSNLPVSFVPRNGVKLGDLTKDQRAKALAVVAAVLSKDGYQKVLDIMAGDQLLAEGKGGGKGPKGGKGGGPMFGADLYYLALFGRPSDTRPWMVQFGGHHLGINVTVVGKHFVLTPTHTGAQPARFQRDGKEVRPLGPEADAAYRLVAALDDKQKAQAVIGDRPQGELVAGPGRDGRAVEPRGVLGADLTADQQGKLMDVVAAWVTIAEPDSARARLAAIREKVGQTRFAWSGPTTPGSAAYFRVQGPNVLIEYAPQGGTDHIHTVVRNPEDEYGVGTLRR